jgi:serine/threonine protein kinase
MSPCAIKKLKFVKQDLEAQMESELRQEAALMLKLRHPNIVELYAMVRLKDGLCLVMELLPNGSFRDHIDKKSLDTCSIAKIIYGSFKGLNYLHSRTPETVIHRDMKAANILLDHALDAKLTDFGLSRLTATAAREQTASSFGGTIGWMAPELLRCDEQYTAMVDVYAMGMVIYEAFTCKVPFSGGHLGSIMTEVVEQQKRPDVWEPKSETEREMISLMYKCWSQEPLGRPTVNTNHSSKCTLRPRSPIPASPPLFLRLSFSASPSPPLLLCPGGGVRCTRPSDIQDCRGREQDRPPQATRVPDPVAAAAGRGADAAAWRALAAAAAQGGRADAAAAGGTSNSRDAGRGQRTISRPVSCGHYRRARAHGKMHLHNRCRRPRLWRLASHNGPGVSSAVQLLHGQVGC